MREKSRMLAKVPGGPRSHAMKPTMPTNIPNPMVPAWLAGFWRILLIVFEYEVSIALCLLRRSNIFVLALWTFTLINAWMFISNFPVQHISSKLFWYLFQKDVDSISQGPFQDNVFCKLLIFLTLTSRMAKRRKSSEGPTLLAMHVQQLRYVT